MKIWWSAKPWLTVAFACTKLMICWPWSRMIRPFQAAVSGYCRRKTNAQTAMLRLRCSRYRHPITTPNHNAAIFLVLLIVASDPRAAPDIIASSDAVAPDDNAPMLSACQFSQAVCKGGPIKDWSADHVLSNVADINIGRYCIKMYPIKVKRFVFNRTGSCLSSRFY